MRQGSFKRLLSMIGALGFIIPVSLNVVACGRPQFQDFSDQEVVNEINRVNTYSITVVIRSTVNDVRNQITPNFIKSMLDENTKRKFQDASFNLEKIFNERQEELRDQDLIVDTELNGTFTYNYGNIKNQTVKLRIIVTESRLVLSKIFENFKFKDSRDVEGFLDSNYQKEIIDQASAHINESLESAGITWENLSSNSILIKAKDNSKKYQGEVTLTWNLKLFELWGAPVEDSEDNDIKDGLKLYFYLDSKDNKLKAFDVAQYKIGRPVYIIRGDGPSYDTHGFAMENNEGKREDYSVFSHELTSEASRKFSGFDFTTGIKVYLIADPGAIKLFNKNEKKWIDVEKKEYYIDVLGNIN